MLSFASPMDPVEEIKARLPIEELVGQYCQLQKKGRTLSCICPFHNDKHPSMNVSPDKGIAYCFACNSGGDIFSFYQLIEGVDFRQALKDLAEKTGVEIQDMAPVQVSKKDEKDRMRSCLEAALKFYKEQLKKSEVGKTYIRKRKLLAKHVEQFQIGVAPDSFSATYEHLLKEGFSKSEILGAGLGVQKDLKEGKIYDRFRNRLMFPIHDVRGGIVGFGGRALGEADAKYINSSEGPLYNKSNILYGLHYAKDAMRKSKKVIMVEGYFDVIACHRVGIENVVAVSGTALTEQHVKILKRSSDTVILCLDQDRAGQDAAERAFHLCSAKGLHVQVVTLEQKDPDEVVNTDPDGLKKTLKEEGQAYIEHVLSQIESSDISSVEAKREALHRILPLLKSVPTEVERGHYITRAASVFGATETALKDDLANVPSEPVIAPQPEEKVIQESTDKDTFSKMEIALGLFFLYPKHIKLIDQLIEPKEGFAAALYKALKEIPEGERKITVEMLDIPEEFRERASILQLFCEHHNFGDWSDGLAVRELEKNCLNANRAILRKKQDEIERQLIEACKEGRKAEEEQLSTKYRQLLKLTKMSM